MNIIEKTLGEICPYEKNPRKNDEAVKYVAESIKQFGFKVPIVIDANGVIVAGHTRYKAAKRLKMNTVPCIVADDLTEEQIKAYRLADNKVSEKAEWDFDLLNEELDELFDIDMTAFGFEYEMEDEPEETHQDDFEAEIPVEPKAKLGDIYQLGNHRLMCGSSTNIEDVEKLMNGDTARMLFTSPPYSDMREYEGGKNLDVDNIALFIATYRPFVDYQCVNLGIQRKENEIFQYWDEYIRIAKESGYKLLAWNVWDKMMCGSIGQQSAFFPIRHEWIFVFGTEFFEINQTWEKKEENIGKLADRKVRQADGSMKLSSKGDTTNKYKQMESVLPLYPELGEVRSVHPATFPVGLPGEYIKSMSDDGDVVIEPFCGSGTTLIACEQLGRRCYGMELEPKYVDVIINRWEQFTGQKAVLLNGNDEAAQAAV
jgi:site-specific DNA-methyltransferase (adenine-specific)